MMIANPPILPSSRQWASVRPALSPWLLDALSSQGLHRMTPVQASTLPLFLTNKDVIVEAVTGSGKTLAYLIPMLEKLLKIDAENWPKRGETACMIVAPTRELAAQIDGVLQGLLTFYHESNEEDSASQQQDGGDLIPDRANRKVVSQLLVGGGKSPAQDISTFLNDCPQIIIGTPGRLSALLGSSHVRLGQSAFQVLILDEADRLLDLGFKADLQNILQRLPKQRRTGLFSASVNDAVGEIIRVGLRNPYRVTVKVRSNNSNGEVHPNRSDEIKTPSSLEMAYLITRPEDKLYLFTQLLNNLPLQPVKTIAYLPTCAAVDYITKLLVTALPNSVITPLHGQLTQSARLKNFTKFSNSTSPAVLVTTDLAARGLDVQQVDLVVQLDPPSDPKTFLHRAGRAGRAGRQGLAVVFLMPAEEDYIRLLAVRSTPVTPLTELYPGLLPHIDVESKSNTDLESFHAKLQEMVRSDRAIHEKAQRAFVSWVQAYRKHQASTIFRLKDLDWAGLARGWDLLVLPKMPELSTWKSKGGDPLLGRSIAWDEYSYADTAREAQRRLPKEPGKERIKQAQRPRPTSDPVSWSEHLVAQKLKEERREKKRKRREVIRVTGLTEAEKEAEDDLEKRVATIKKRKVEA